jgi:hypothetical protein
VITDACAAGRADCDESPGCETDATSPTSCGACGVRCIDGVEMCSANEDGVYGCASSCGGTTPDRCGDRCVDTLVDAAHCGSCGNACPGVPFGTGVCVDGGCAIACASGYHPCGDACVPNDDVATCGSACAPCPVPSNAVATCDGTACGFTCLTGFADCDANPANGCEANLTSTSTCGASCTVCPVPANAAPTCNGTACGFTCLAGFADCDANPANGCEANLASPSTCGPSCTVCPSRPNAAPTCDGTTCGFACLTGFADCDANPANGCEANLASPTSCGSCALDCTALPGVTAAVGCQMGTCNLTGACAPGRADCGGGASDGCETSLASATSCGGCGVTCDAATETCEPSGSTFACSNGCEASTPTRCGDACVDLASSVAHCGACGASCSAPTGGSPTCSSGTCGFACNTGRHRCGDACLPDGDVASCGTSCTPCPVPANAIPTCNGVSCGFTCQPGFADCDGDAANGCELSLVDPAGRVVFCDGFEGGLGAWSVESFWGLDSTAFRGTRSLRGFWGGNTSTGCGITRSTYLARDLDLSGATSARLEFRHRAVVGARDRLYVLVSTNRGATWTSIDNPGGSGSFVLRNLDLSAYAGSPSVRIGFRFDNICGDADGVTWWIDDVAVHAR